jgi:hypothetical protein
MGAAEDLSQGKIYLWLMGFRITLSGVGGKNEQSG